MAVLQGGSPNARFLAGDVPHGERETQRLGGAFSVSLLSHIVGFLLFLFVMSLPSPPSAPTAQDKPPSEIVWLQQPGPGGGGGGGGNQMKEPPGRSRRQARKRSPSPR